MTHSQRCQRMVELGRQGTAPVRELCQGNVYERGLALWSCYGSRAPSWRPSPGTARPGCLHADALAAGVAALRPGFFLQANSLDALEEALAASPTAESRRLGLAALISAAAPPRGWTEGCGPTARTPTRWCGARRSSCSRRRGSLYDDSINGLRTWTVPYQRPCWKSSESNSASPWHSA